MVVSKYISHLSIIKKNRDALFIPITVFQTERNQGYGKKQRFTVSIYQKDSAVRGYQICVLAGCDWCPLLASDTNLVSAPLLCILMLSDH